VTVKSGRGKGREKKKKSMHTRLLDVDPSQICIWKLLCAICHFALKFDVSFFARARQTPKPLTFGFGIQFIKLN
jgi:hypothetical protein